MDPYIEHPDVWSDFHGGLADEIRAELREATAAPLRCPAGPARDL